MQVAKNSDKIFYVSELSPEGGQLTKKVVATKVFTLFQTFPWSFSFSIDLLRSNLTETYFSDKVWYAFLSVSYDFSSDLNFSSMKGAAEGFMFL